jgi:hypothetical protein
LYITHTLLIRYEDIQAGYILNFLVALGIDVTFRSQVMLWDCSRIEITLLFEQ